MESFQSASTIPFRSKKPTLHATPKKKAKLMSEDRSMMLETPERSSRPPRVRNQNMAFSIKDVKRTAKMFQKRDLNESSPGSDPVRSLRLGSEMQALGKAQRSSVKCVERSVELPEKYLMLCEFFNVMVSVIPLLKMRRVSPSFTNICPKIQSLTDRRFTVNHLAQLKYILPEAIVVKKIQVRDEQTDCMKEELIVTLDTETVKGSNNVKAIRELFQANIQNYYQAHQEENDIPEAELPALFYQSNQSETSRIGKSSCVATPSHVPQFFQRSFSRQVSNEKSENPTVQGRQSLVSEPLSVLATPIKSSLATCSGEDVLKNDGSKGSIDIKGTPVKEGSTGIQLMANTPDIQPSNKRCYMSPDYVTSDVPAKLVRRPIRARSLKFDAPEDYAETEVQDDDAPGSNVDNDIIDFFPKSLLQSVREKERKILQEQDPAISEARRRHQLMSSVPKLFDMVHLLFQSISRSVMTKEELLYKLIAGHSDIVDRGEVEKQFDLLLELAPEYIYVRLCKSGDTLVCVNKSVSAQIVRAKLL